MVAATYDAAMTRVFNDEGGYTNDPRDPGGPTNWGITIYDARKYWKENATAEDVKAMPKDVAAQIYKNRYAAPILYDSLPAGFDYSMLDAAINSGIGRAIPWGAYALQSPSVDATGVMLAAKRYPDKVDLIQRYWVHRVSFLHGLSTWSHFGPGWSRRCSEGEAAAVKMWLTFGKQAMPDEQTKTMKTESGKASTAVKKNATAAGGTGLGGGVLPAIDWSHLSMGDKVMVALFIVGLVGFVIYYARKVMIHQHRSQAYAAAA